MKKFIVLVLGQFISSIGSGLTDFGLAIYVYILTGSVMATSIISICAFLPSVVLAPIGGVLADHYDRRLMMIFGELFSGLSLLICIGTIASNNPSFIVICIGVAVNSIFAALIEPSFKASISDLLTEEDFAKAGGITQIAANAKLLVSPLIAGILMQFTTVNTLIWIDILTFFTTVFVILYIKKGRETKKQANKNLDFVRELQFGLKAINKKGIVAIIVVMTLAVFCLGFVQILSKPLALSFTGEKELGIITTICACGMLVGSLFVSCLKNIKSYQKILAFGLVFCGLFLGLMGVKENIYWMTVCGFLMFLCMPIIQVAADVMIRKSLPNEVQGRAFGMIGFISQLGYIVAYLLSGVLSDQVFEPFMRGDSTIALLIGKVIGDGVGRGIALLLFFVGVLLAILGVVFSRIRCVKALEDKA